MDSSKHSGRTTRLLTRWGVAAALAWAGAAMAQTTQNIPLDQAQRAITAAIAEARKLNLNMAVAVVDTAGQLVAFERMDSVFPAALAVSQDKARSAAIYRRPTKAFQDALAGGGVGQRVLMLQGAIAVEGGVPLMLDGKVVGAIGVSGGSPDQDGAVAKAGVDALAK